MAYPENDSQFEDWEISKVSGNAADGWQISFVDGWSFFVPKDSPIEPKPGMKTRLYGKGIGYTVRGLFIEGQQVFYRTESEDKAHGLAQSYGTDAADWLARWDSGRSVFTIEMGGMGPGYEQAIQITVAEILRHMLAEKYDAESWEVQEFWDKDRKAIEKFSFSNPVINDLGLSGAMWGAALNLASRLYMRGPIAVMTDEQVKDRHIQVSKNWPKAA